MVIENEKYRVVINKGMMDIFCLEMPFCVESSDPVIAAALELHRNKVVERRKQLPILRVVYIGNEKFEIDLDFIDSRMIRKVDVCQIWNYLKKCKFKSHQIATFVVHIKSVVHNYLPTTYSEPTKSFALQEN